MDTGSITNEIIIDEMILNPLSYNKSWTAYIKYVLFLALMILISIVIFASNHLFGLIIFFLSLLFIIYKFIYLKTFKVIIDDKGVWVFSGVFPWDKGFSGVKWRDLDEAVYFNSIFSYFFKSYSLSVRHRFTKSNEFNLISINRGDLAVMEINRRHEYMISNNLI